MDSTEVIQYPVNSNLEQKNVSLSPTETSPEKLINLSLTQQQSNFELEGSLSDIFLKQELPNPAPKVNHIYMPFDVNSSSEVATSESKSLNI